MDTPSDSSGALDANQAVTALSSLFDPQPVADKDDETDIASTETEVQAEDAQANPDAEQTTQDDDDPTVTVKVDGKDVEVKLSELKGSYQKDKAANQRFEQAAELRKQADAEWQKSRQERQTYAQQLQGIVQQAQTALQQQQNIDWESLKANDPVEFVNQVRLAQERQALLARGSTELQRVGALEQADQAQRHQAYLAEQQKSLLDKLPAWKDEAKAKVERTKLRDYLTREGYSEGEVSGVADSRAVLMARKAMLYDEMVSKASAASKKVAQLPTKVERSGTGQNLGVDRRTSAFQQLSKTGRVEDAAAVLANFF